VVSSVPNGSSQIFECPSGTFGLSRVNDKNTARERCILFIFFYLVSPGLLVVTDVASVFVGLNL